jgi:hypothetical protein
MNDGSIGYPLTLPSPKGRGLYRPGRGVTVFCSLFSAHFSLISQLFAQAGCGVVIGGQLLAFFIDDRSGGFFGKVTG